MLETIKGTLNAVSATITLTLADGGTATLDFPLRRGLPSVYEFDIDRKEDDITSWWTPLLVSSVSTTYQEMRLTLPMDVQENGSFFTITQGKSDDGA